MSIDKDLPAHTDDEAWGAIGEGLRPSTVLVIGSILTLAGPAFQLIEPLRGVAWIIWTLALFVVGAGLILSGLRPWLNSIAVTVGCLYLAHALALLIALQNIYEAAVVYRIIGIAKLLSLGLLALRSREAFGKNIRWLLAVAGFVGAFKVSLNVLELMPSRLAYAADLGQNIFTAVALFLSARGLRRRENEWAHGEESMSTASFEDFNKR
jgi:hypothetical protein